MKEEEGNFFVPSTIQGKLPKGIGPVMIRRCFHGRQLLQKASVRFCVMRCIASGYAFYNSNKEERKNQLSPIMAWHFLTD